MFTHKITVTHELTVSYSHSCQGLQVYNKVMKVIPGKLVPTDEAIHISLISICVCLSLTKLAPIPESATLGHRLKVTQTLLYVVKFRKLFK